MEETNCRICKQHSGHGARLKEVEIQTDKQWKEIDGMKNWLVGTLVSVILTLIAVGVNIVINLANG